MTIISLEVLQMNFTTVKPGEITSSPGSKLQASRVRCYPDVEELTAIAYFEPDKFINFSSNFWTQG